MKKLDLFVEGCKALRWKWRAWRISLFTVTMLPEDYEVEPFDIDYRKDGTYWYNGETSKWEQVEDATPLEPLYGVNELANFPDDVTPNQSEALQTTYGRVLFNWMVVTYAFDNKIPFFHNGLPNDIVKQFAQHVVDEDDDVSDGTLAYRPSEVARFVKGLFELTSLCTYIAPTGTEKSLTTHPDMAKKKQELFEKYADQLDDPAVVAQIQDELVALDKEWCDSEEDKGFFTSNKSFTVRRKKMFIMHGVESAFEEDGKGELIKAPLSEGWDMTKLPAKYNAIREGSFDRGRDTALGGEKVTFMQRVYQNAKVIEGDCGTKIADRRLLDENNIQRYIGLNMVEKGAIVELTPDNKDQYMGKVVALRRPILCQAPMMDFCSVCASRSLAKNPRGVAAEISAIASDIMLAFMSSMHGVELAVAHYDFKKQLT